MKLQESLISGQDLARVNLQKDLVTIRSFINIKLNVRQGGRRKEVEESLRWGGSLQALLEMTTNMSRVPVLDPP